MKSMAVWGRMEGGATWYDTSKEVADSCIALTLKREQ